MTTVDIPHRRRPRRTRSVGALTASLAVAGLALLSACGSDTATTSGAAGTTSAAAPSTAAADTAFDQCMAANGVTKPADAPDGAPGGPPPAGQPGPPPAGQSGPQPGAAGAAPPGVDAATWTKALAACQSVAGAPGQATTTS